MRRGLAFLGFWGLLQAPLGCTEGSFDLGYDWPVSGGGAGGAPGPVYGEAVWIEEVTSDTNQDDATMTADGLELYFASKRDAGVGREDVWVSKRPSVTASWGAAELVGLPNSVERETAPAIAPDGLTLWFASDRSGGLGALDVWVATRSSRSVAFSDAVHVAELSTTNDDLPRAPNATAKWLPLARKTTRGDADLWLVPLSSGPKYGVPVSLSEVNTSFDESDPTLSADGLTLLFASNREEPSGDLYRATRATIEAPFSDVRPLSELNTEFEESDPWLSGDESMILFSSRRTGQLEVYEALRL